MISTESILEIIRKGKSMGEIIMKNAKIIVS